MPYKKREEYMSDQPTAIQPILDRKLERVHTGGPKFTPAQRELVLARVAELYMKAVGPYAIAKDIGVTAHTAITYIKVLEKRWRESALRDFDKARAYELAKLEHLELTYWDAWERSCAESSQTQTVIEPGKDADGNEIPRRKRQTVRKIEQVGDPRFLEGVFKCIDRRIKLLGLDAAERHIIDTTGVSDNALSQRLAKYAVVFGATVIENAPGPALDDGTDEPVDSERPPSETSGVLDAHYELRRNGL